ncbi:MAG: Hint domain-containing protein [Candidatus Thiodiazotropha sp.]
MPKDANEVEIERQKSEMIGKGYTHNEINNPNIRSEFGNTGQSASEYHKSHGVTRSNGCFPADTEIKTPYGWKPIKDLSTGSVVVSYTKRGQLVNSKVLQQCTHTLCNIVTIVTADRNASFTATEIHAVNTSGGWLRINQLKAGDRVTYLADNGKIACHTVLSIEKTERRETVYNLIVEGHYTFITRSCLAHSFSYFRAVRIQAYEFLRRTRSAVSIVRGSLALFGHAKKSTWAR